MNRGDHPYVKLPEGIQKRINIRVTYGISQQYGEHLFRRCLQEATGNHILHRHMLGRMDSHLLVPTSGAF